MAALTKLKLIKLLDERGTYKEEFDAVINHYFEVCSFIKDCKKDIKDKGVMLSLPNGFYQKHPAAELLTVWIKERRMTIVQLGLSPASLKGIDIEEEEEPDGFPK